ncbi:MAG TPA: sigma 54-interacting transcriptional regulator [Kofleriaceae bacterium]|nr:sigma 54-interacting transcriptional regulator [Kofleriaceae bacterium]
MPKTEGWEDAQLPVVGEAHAARLRQLAAFAGLDETVLLSGPSGAGKSRLAAWCHSRSPRCGGPFVTVDLLSVPPELQMGELYGWRRGAFTNALADQDGCLARGAGGTVFIDEIDKLSLTAQAGLLHLLETRRYRVLGDPGRQREADVRFIIASNADLKAEVARGRFREDLYFRINVLPFRVLPLDERRDEIVRWAEHLLARRHRGRGAAGAAFEADAAALLAASRWPGNLRELDSVVCRAYAFAAAETAPGAELRITAAHITAALGLDADADAGAATGGAAATAPDLMARLRDAADSFVDHLVAGGAELRLEHTDALRGLVLEAGLRRLGDLREVFVRLGGDVIVRSRNHGREYRREYDKVVSLEAAIARTTSCVHGDAGDVADDAAPAPR